MCRNGIVAQTCHPSTQETGAHRLQVEEQPKLFGEFDMASPSNIVNNVITNHAITTSFMVVVI